MSQVHQFRRVHGASYAKRAARRRYAAARLETMEPRTLFSMVTGVVGVGTPTIKGAAYDNSGTLYLSVYDPELGPAIEKIGAGNPPATLYSDGDASQFDGLVAGSAGTLYFINNALNTILKYDPSSAGVSTIFTPDAGAPQIKGLTVSGNDVWFYTASVDNLSGPGHINTVGQVHMNGTNSPTTTLITLADDPTLKLTDAVALSPAQFHLAGNVTVDGVYVGLKGLDTTVNPDGSVIGQSAIGVAYVNGASTHFSYVVPSSTDAATQDVFQFGELTSIATDPFDGSVWFSMGPGMPSQKLKHPANAIGHMTLNATLDGSTDAASYTVKDAQPGDDMMVASLAFDSNGDLYFVETARNKVGMLDTNLAGTSGAFSDAPLADLSATELSTQPSVVAVNPTLPSSAADVAATVIAATGFTWQSVHASVDVVPTEVEFNASLAFPTTVNEDTLYAHKKLVMFTAPTANYVAVINWGDGTSQTVAAQLVDPNVPNIYVVYVDKTFAKQSAITGNLARSFSASVIIRDTAGVQADHELDFAITVTDTPLVVSDISITTLLSRIATLTLSFTDDVDSKVSNFSVNINWDDGSTSKGVVLKDPTTPGQYFVMAIHVYKRRSTYHVTATVTSTEEGLTSSVTKTSTLIL